VRQQNAETPAMNLQLDGARVLVTAGASGIGLATARAFVREGARVHVCDVDRSALDALATTDPTFTRSLCDVADRAAVARLFDDALGALGGLDVLVNNAGIATHRNTEDIDLDYWRAALDINITAPFLCAREAIRMMKVQQPQGGRIINIGSVSAKTPRPDSMPYTVTKFGLQGMTHQLTMDGRKHDIVASIIHPGATLSSFSTRRGRTKAGPGERPDDYVMAAEDVARVAVLMAALPGEVNLYEATILPNHMRSFIGRG
jgi:NAD(P)-dependent dehydrogenase (short-subunit alcohol dehydrogenase family)